MPVSRSTHPDVLAFTDAYKPTFNGVTYTLEAWHDHWNDTGGTFELVYPDAPGYAPADETEHPVTSFPFPFYEGYRTPLPVIPCEIRDLDIIHAHTPFSLGLAARRYANQHDKPLVATYHTPVSEYTTQVTSLPGVSTILETGLEAYERWFYNQADLVFTPSEPTRTHLQHSLGIETPVQVVSNGVDTDFFEPVDPTAFKRRHGLTDTGALVGFCGRHCREKRVSDILAIADGMDDVTVVFAGRGPATDRLKSEAEQTDADIRFLGFLDRDELPAFYSALDVFLFPSPVETEGLTAREAIACGTPVVGADQGALSDTIPGGETGYTVQTGAIEKFRHAVWDALDKQDELAAVCLSHRDSFSVTHSLQTVAEAYQTLLNAS